MTNIKHHFEHVFSHDWPNMPDFTGGLTFMPNMVKTKQKHAHDSIKKA